MSGGREESTASKMKILSFSSRKLPFQLPQQRKPVPVALSLQWVRLLTVLQDFSLKVK